MKKIFALQLLILAGQAFSQSHGTSSGGGHDPCEGPEYSFRCNISVYEENTLKENLKDVLFTKSNYKQLFGKDARYEVTFCSEYKNNKLHISTYNYYFDNSEINHLNSALSISLDQKDFEMSYGVQFAGNYINDKIRISCVNQKP